MKPINLLQYCLLLSFWGLYFLPASAQTLLYQENFDSQLGEGFTGPVLANATFTSTNGKWSLETSAIQGIFDANDHARVEDSAIFFPFTGLPFGDALQFRDIDEVVTFRTQSIDISNYDSARFSLRLFEVGSLESADSIQVAYILDGVRTRVVTLFDDFSGTGSSSTSDPSNTNPLVVPVSAGQLVGSTLEIEVLADCNSSSEFYHIDSVEVFGLGSGTPVNTPPVVTCPANDTIYTDPGFCDVGLPDFRSQAIIVDDTDPNPSVFQSPSVSDPLFGPFYLPGIYTVTISATDSDGATGSCQFTVTVLDSVPPLITCPSDQTLDCTANLPDYRNLLISNGVCATIDTIIQLPAPGSFIDKDTVVTFSVIDSFGISNSCTINVTLTGTTADTTNLTATTCDPMQVGVDTVTLANQTGCDSLVITTTTLLQSDTTEVAVGSCDPMQVGVDTVTLTNQAGCDSLVITTTTLLPSDTTEVAANSCDPMQVGVDTVTLTNQAGCDSLVITTTTLLQSDTTETAANSCDPTQVGVDTVTLTNQVGCDSLVITTTTLLPSDTTELILLTTDSTQVGADSLSLTNQFGCDSLVITLTVLDTATNILSLSEEVRIFPNPTQGWLTIDMGTVVEPVAYVIIRDVQGREVLRVQPTKGQSSIPVDLTMQAKGVYLMEVQVKGYPSLYTKILR
ncbi:MAG: T9SS type A sorting domain-containing protein, partial [Bacteroidota bacterium]